eukprot:COSAG02_NODE_2515_length_8621_cov_13.085074_10_plen_92_part_00
MTRRGATNARTSARFRRHLLAGAAGGRFQPVRSEHLQLQCSLTCCVLVWQLAPVFFCKKSLDEIVHYLITDYSLLQVQLVIPVKQHVSEIG